MEFNVSNDRLNSTNRVIQSMLVNQVQHTTMKHSKQLR